MSCYSCLVLYLHGLTIFEFHLVSESESTAQKIKFSAETADFVTFTEEILSGNLHFLCIEGYHRATNF